MIDVKFIKTYLISLLAAVAMVGFFASCADRRPIEAGRIVARTEIAGFNGSEFYAEVKEGSLPEMYGVYRATLSDLGMPKAKWDEKFDCNHLADIYVAANQVKFAVDNWHTATKAQALALGVIWYQMDTGLYHAIIEARIGGRIAYIDPAIGAGEVKLSQSEIKSIYFRKY